MEDGASVHWKCRAEKLGDINLVIRGFSPLCPLWDVKIEQLNVDDRSVPDYTISWRCFITSKYSMQRFIRDLGVDTHVMWESVDFFSSFAYERYRGGLHLVGEGADSDWAFDDVVAAENSQDSTGRPACCSPLSLPFDVSSAHVESPAQCRNLVFDFWEDTEPRTPSPQ